MYDKIYGTLVCNYGLIVKDFYVFVDDSDTLTLYFLSQGESYSIATTRNQHLPCRTFRQSSSRDSGYRHLTTLPRS